MPKLSEVQQSAPKQTVKLSQVISQPAPQRQTTNPLEMPEVQQRQAQFSQSGIPENEARRMALENTPNKADIKGSLQGASDAFFNSPVGKVASQAAISVNRGAADIVDFFTTDQINAIRQMIGKEPDVPTLRGAINVLSGGEMKGPEVQFMEPGIARDVVSGAGEVVPAAVTGGAVLRGIANQLPAVTGATRTLPGAIKQLGSTTGVQDAALGAVSGAGGEIGQEVGGDVGQLVGAIVAPVGAEASKNALKSLINLGQRGISALTTSLSQMSDDEAARLLSEAMIREGMGPEDVTRRLAELGPEAMPADVGNSFSRLLRAASNRIPQIEGRAAEVLNTRQAGSGARIAGATNEIVAGNVDDAIQRYSAANGPRVKALYDEVRSKPIELSGRLKNLMEGKNSVSKARKKAESRLADKRAAGDEISHIDVIDATKQELDDQIGAAMRSGENNRARDLIRLKNIMVDEADAAIPEYKQARDLFAGGRQMEKAAELGEQYFRLKPREVSDLTRTMGASEKEMFKLGAKRAIEDKILDLNTNADQVRRLFGKNGDVTKLRSLFDDQASFNRFSRALEREANFALTRRAAQGNSTTAKQLQDLSAAQTAADDARAILMGGTAEKAGAINRILGRMTGSRRDEAFVRGLEQAGDILLEANVNPERVRNLLRSGSKKMIEKELRQALKMPENTSVSAPVSASVAAQVNDE